MAGAHAAVKLSAFLSRAKREAGLDAFRKAVEDASFKPAAYQEAFFEGVNRLVRVVQTRPDN